MADNFSVSTPSTFPAPASRYVRVLSIAGSDSGGGAGIQADLKTFAALGCYGMTAITALTAQNTRGVGGIHAVPPAFLKAQLQAVIEDIGVDAVKLGMLHAPEVVEVVAWAIDHYGLQRVVLDPVTLCREAASVSAFGVDLKKNLFISERTHLILPTHRALDKAAEQSKGNEKIGSTLKGISKPGEIIWSRIYIENDRLNMDLGRAGVVQLPLEETQRRWNATTPQWPIMHAVTYGVSRDQMMAKHNANHIQVAYATDAKNADSALLAKAAFAQALGINVNLCGTKKNGKPWT